MMNLLKHSLSDMPADVILGPPKDGIAGIITKVRQKVRSISIDLILDHRSSVIFKNDYYL